MTQREIEEQRKAIAKQIRSDVADVRTMIAKWKVIKK